MVYRPPTTVERRLYPHAIQSHQKRMSKPSNICTKKISNEKPYRAGHRFAGPPSSEAQAFSSCSKNLAIRDRTFSVSRSFSFLESGLSVVLDSPFGLSGSAPKNRRIERRSSTGFSSRSSKKKIRKRSGST